MEKSTWWILVCLGFMVAMQAILTPVFTDPENTTFSYWYVFALILYGAASGDALRTIVDRATTPPGEEQHPLLGLLLLLAGFIMAVTSCLLLTQFPWTTQWVTIFVNILILLAGLDAVLPKKESASA